MTTETSEQIFEYNKHRKVIPETDLAGCPLCGNPVKGWEMSYHGMVHQMKIRCNKCALDMYTTDADPERMVARAIAKWNNRCE